MAGRAAELTPRERALCKTASALRATSADAKPGVDVEEVCHPKQAGLVRVIVERLRRNIAALAGRQSGKSHGGAALAPMLRVLQEPGVNAIVVTSTYATCEKMAFLPAVELNRQHGLGGRPIYGGKMQIRFPNGSVVYYLGADSAKTVQRLRGTPNLVLVVIDEAGIYDPDTLAEMIRAVRPGLRPRAGALCVMGTPSRTGKQGTWYDITQNPEFDQHRFDYRDNDRVPTYLDVEAIIDEDLRAEFPDKTPAEARVSAWFKREYLALFEVDLAEMVYQLADGNLVDDIPEGLESHATGGDLGMSANDALVTLGWTRIKPPDVFVTDQEEESGQDSVAYAAMVSRLNARRRPMSIDIDPGGLGQKTIKTVKRMYPTIPINEAQKPPVGIQVRAVNNLLQGVYGWTLRIKRGSKLALELATPTWVDGLVGGEIDEHGRHSDLVPSLRYVALRVAGLLPAVAPPPTVDEIEQARYAALVARAERNKLAAQGPKPYDPAEFQDDPLGDLA